MAREYPLVKDQISIFLFHGVVRENTYWVRNYIRKHVEADYFASLLKGWSSTGTPLSLDQLLECQREPASLPPYPFVVTFDDGFENNLSVAAPILSDLNIPCMFYLTTNWVTHNQMGWIDKIEWAFEHSRAGQLRLPWSSEVKTFHSRESAIKVLDDIRAHVKSDPKIVPEEIVSAVFQQLGTAGITSSDDPLDLKLTWNQARELASNPLFSIGGHTQSHAILSFLDNRSLDHEIGGCLQIIERELGSRPTHFAYPDGQAHHYNQEVINELKEHGIRCCPTAIDGINQVTDDPFHLRRIFVS